MLLLIKKIETLSINENNEENLCKKRKESIDDGEQPGRDRRPFLTTWAGVLAGNEVHAHELENKYERV